MAEAVDRPGWIEANLAGLAAVLEPRRSGSAATPGAAGDRRRRGGDRGRCRVGLPRRPRAGQYEFPVLEPDKPARLLFVAPNLAHAAKSLDAPTDQLLRWVALHEMTHALQFGGVPWLRPHLKEMLGELLGALEFNPRSLSVCPMSQISRSSSSGCARTAWRRS